MLFNLHKDTFLTDECFDTACIEPLQELQNVCGEMVGHDVLHSRDRLLCVLEHHKLHEKITLISEEDK